VRRKKEDVRGKMAEGRRKVEGRRKKEKRGRIGKTEEETRRQKKTGGIKIR